MEHVWNKVPGNAASSHREGKKAAAVLSDARARIAALVGAQPEEVFLTAGATEASNIAVRGGAHARKARGRHIVSTSMEHSATKRAVEALAMEGWGVNLLRPDQSGLIDPEQLAQAITPGTTLVSVIAGHNELGTIQPLQALAEAAHAGGAWLHLDAVQAVAYLPIGAVPWDLLSLTAHKLGGPQGIGALVVRGAGLPRPVLVGGTQEGGLRPGTVAVALAAGFGAAAESALPGRKDEADRLTVLRNRLAQGIQQRCPEALPIGAWRSQPERSLPHVLTLGIEAVRGDELIYALDEFGVAAASASACLGDSRSHVLDAIGLPEQVGIMRLSLGWNSDSAMIDTAVGCISNAIIQVMGMAPFERRRPILAAHAGVAGVALTQAHWEAAEAIFEFHRKEGVLPGARYLGRALRPEHQLEDLFPEGMFTLAQWLGIPIPQGGCRPGGL